MKAVVIKGPGEVMLTELEQPTVRPDDMLIRSRAVGICSSADLAAAAGMKLLVPTHYEMFAANQGRPSVLVDYVRAYHPALTCYVPAHGRRFTYMKGDLS